MAATVYETERQPQRRGVSSGDKTLFQNFSNKMILEGQIKDQQVSSFHLISKHALHINFLCIFFMNY